MITDELNIQLTTHSEERTRRLWGSRQKLEELIDGQPRPWTILTREGCSVLVCGNTRITFSQKRDPAEPLTPVAETITTTTTTTTAMTSTDPHSDPGLHLFETDTVTLAPETRVRILPPEKIKRETGSRSTLTRMLLYPGFPPGRIPLTCRKKMEQYWVSPETTKCPGCGETVPSPRCPACRKRLAPGRGIHCQWCGAALPPKLAVPAEVLFVLDTQQFMKLPPPRRETLSATLWRMRQGRDCWTMPASSSGGSRHTGTVWYMRARDEQRALPVAELEKLAHELEEARVGAIVRDPGALASIRTRIEESERPRKKPAENQNENEKEKKYGRSETEAR